MIEARGTPRAALVQRYILPRLTGQYSICDALLKDQTPVNGRFEVPPSFDGGEGSGALSAMGVSYSSASDVPNLCNTGRAPAASGPFSAERVFGAYAVPSLDTERPAPMQFAPRSSLAEPLQPAKPEVPPVIAVHRLRHMQPTAAVELVNPLCETFGGCKATQVPGQPSIALSGDPEAIQTVSRFLTDVDKPQVAYRLRATLFELDRSSGRVLGVDLNLGTNVFLRSQGTSADNGAITLGVNYSGAFAALTAQEEQGNAVVLSRPELRLTDGQASTFSSSTEVPTVSQIIYDENGRQTQGIEYREAGLIMNVTLRAAGRSVELDLAQELSSFGRASAVAGNPSKVKRSLRSTFSIPLGQPVIIGGLLRQSSDDTASRVPVLGWPLRNSRTVSNTDVYLLVQVDTEVVSEPDEEAASGTVSDRTEGVSR